ncbi:MAG: hypothetical protein U1E49_14570 [Hyphomicrobiaceae bacterium]
MKSLTVLALVAGVFGLGSPAASAAALSPAAGLTTPAHVTSICDCRDGNNVSSGFYSGFVDTPYDGPSTGYYGTSGFYGDRYSDDDGAAPPYAFFPDRYRSERLWGWAPRPRNGYGYDD